METSPLNNPSETRLESAKLSYVQSLEENRTHDNEVDDLLINLELADFTLLSDKKEDGIGTIKTSLATFTDGSIFALRETIPEKQLWDTPVEWTLPLTTRLNGFNNYMARKFAEHSIRTRMVGTNQAQGFSLLHDAQASLHIFNVLDEQHASKQKELDLEPEYTLGESVRVGYSMGEMKLLVELGLAPLMNRDIKFTIGLDPCLAKKVDYKIELEHKANLAKYLGREVLELSGSIGKNMIHDRNILRTAKRLSHFISTIGITPKYFSIQYDKWNQIATGDTGKYLGKIPEDAVTIIHFFDKSHFNDNVIYKAALADHPNFRAVSEHGYHLSGADPRVIGRVVKKTEWGLALLKAGVTGPQLADGITAPVLRD